MFGAPSSRGALLRTTSRTKLCLAWVGHVASNTAPSAPRSVETVQERDTTTLTSRIRDASCPAFANGDEVRNATASDKTTRNLGLLRRWWVKTLSIQQALGQRPPRSRRAGNAGARELGRVLGDHVADEADDSAKLLGKSRLAAIDQPEIVAHEDVRRQP